MEANKMEQTTIISIGIVTLIGLFGIYCIMNIILSIKRNKLLKNMTIQQYESNVPTPDYSESKPFEQQPHKEQYPKPQGYTFNPKKYREQRQQENAGKSVDEVDMEWEEYQRQKHQKENFKYNM